MNKEDEWWNLLGLLVKRKVKKMWVKQLPPMPEPPEYNKWMGKNKMGDTYILTEYGIVKLPKD